MTIAVLGEALIDLIAGDDGAYRPHLGGSPYNVAIGLARQGIDVSYLSSLSDDSFGDQLRESLSNEKVTVPLQRRSLWPTSLAVVTVDDGGQSKLMHKLQCSSSQSRTLADISIRSFFEKLVMTGVDNKQVRLVANQFVHQLREL